MCTRVFARLATVIAVAFLFSIPSQAVSVSCTIFGPVVTLTISVSYTPPPPPGGTYTVTVDPACDVSGFQLDLLYNPSVATFVSGTDDGSFTQLTAPSVISPGDVRFNGITSTPTPGDVDIFTAQFAALSTTPMPFTAEAYGSDYVTADAMTAGPSSITPASASIPEPSTLLFLVIGLGLLAICRGRLTRRIL